MRSQHLKWRRGKPSRGGVSKPGFDALHMLLPSNYALLHIVVHCVLWTIVAPCCAQTQATSVLCSGLILWCLQESLKTWVSHLSGHEAARRYSPCMSTVSRQWTYHLVCAFTDGDTAQSKLIAAFDSSLRCSQSQGYRGTKASLLIRTGG